MDGAQTEVPKLVNLLVQALFLIAPITLAGILHMMVIKKKLLPSLCVPISKNYFGANKTWRGIVVMTTATAVLTKALCSAMVPPISIVHPMALGALMGLAYTLFELPNSYLKRKMGIAPGEASNSNKKIGFFFFDRFDSAFGCAFALFLSGYDLSLALTCFAAGALVHALVTSILFLLGLKDKI